MDAEELYLTYGEPGSSEERAMFTEKLLDLAPICTFCGGYTVPTGSCHTCPSCGETTGCS